MALSWSDGRSRSLFLQSRADRLQQLARLARSMIIRLVDRDAADALVKVDGSADAGVAFAEIDGHEEQVILGTKAIGFVVVVVSDGLGHRVGPGRRRRVRGRREVDAFLASRGTCGRLLGRRRQTRGSLIRGCSRGRLWLLMHRRLCWGS